MIIETLLFFTDTKIIDKMKFVVVLSILCILCNSEAKVKSRQLDAIKRLFGAEDLTCPDACMRKITELSMENKRQQGQIDAFINLIPDSAKSKDLNHKGLFCGNLFLISFGF